MAEGSPVFSISRVAELLGVDRKTVREQFSAVAEAEARTITVAGQPAKGWPWLAFPPRLRARIEKSARDQGYEDPERFLAHARERWAPAASISQMPPAAIESARIRCAVLAPVLRQFCDQPVSEIAREASVAWKSRPRHPITDRTIRRWIERAMERDRGFRDWSRWEIYLDENLLTCAKPASETTASLAAVLDVPHLADALSRIKVHPCPTAAERAEVWFQAMKEADLLESAGHPVAAIQRAILTAIEVTAVPIAKTSHALRMAYLRKREAWERGGRRFSALQDRRQAAANERISELPTGDKYTLLRLALKHGGRLAPAFREAIRGKLLSAGLQQQFAALPADKSHVPHSIRRAVALDLAQLVERHQGPRNARIKGPWVDRDWSEIAPGDWWVGDDLTPPVYWWDETSAGPAVMRGQLLMLCDAKTDYVLGWVLLSSRSYNGRAIRSLITRCHDEHGLPREGFHFEHGIWKESRILTGQKADADLVDLGDTEKGLGEFGCRFIHANTPGQKTIERVFGLLQDRMENLPGYCGRDERRDCPEAVRRQLDAVAAGREHPSKYFLEKSAFAAELEKIVADFVSEKFGPRARKIPNQSPKEAYEARQTGDLIHLSDRSRYLLANHRVAVAVGRNGIRLRESLGGGLYRNEETGPLIGQQVLAWIDVDAPEVITITSLDRQNPRLVERAPEPRALAAGDQEIRAAEASRREHARHGAALYRVVAGAIKGQFRSLVVDRATVQLGAEMKRQHEARATIKRAAVNLSASFDRLTQARGITIPKPSDPNRLRDVVEMLQADEWDGQQIAQEDVNL